MKCRLFVFIFCLLACFSSAFAEENGPLSITGSMDHAFRAVPLMDLF